MINKRKVLCFDFVLGFGPLGLWGLGALFSVSLFFMFWVFGPLGSWAFGTLVFRGFWALGNLGLRNP